MSSPEQLLKFSEIAAPPRPTEVDTCGHVKSGQRESCRSITDSSDSTHTDDELLQLIDFAPQVLVELEADGTWILANRSAREYTGLTLDEYRSVDVIARVIHPKDAHRVRALRQSQFKGKSPFELEARMLGKDGVYRWFLFRYNPLIKDGRVIRWFGSATEIESRKREEERMRKEFVQLEERTRIAQELHDTLLQSFFLASLKLGIANASLPPDCQVKSELNRILKLMERGIEEGRNAILDLRSNVLSESNLTKALHCLSQEIATEPDVGIRVAVVGRELQLGPAVACEIYRIAKEALVNAYCHSGAQSIELSLEYAENELRMQVRDNGNGIDPVVLLNGRNGHYGLVGMRERATRIGGWLEISSDASGTLVQLLVPAACASGAFDEVSLLPFAPSLRNRQGDPVCNSRWAASY